MKETLKDYDTSSARVYTHRDLPDIQYGLLDPEDIESQEDEDNYNAKEIRSKE